MTPEQIVAGQLDAYNRRCLDDFLGWYADDVQVLGFPSGVELADRSGAAFGPRYRRVFEASPDLHAELVSRTVRGDIVIDHERVTGFLGGAETLEAVAVYQVGPDRITRVWFLD